MRMIAPTHALPPEELIALFDLTPDLVCIASKGGNFLHFNQSVPKTLGYTREELLTTPIVNFIHPDDKARTGITRAEMLKGQNLLNFQNRYITKTGDIVWLEWTSVFIPDKEVVFAIAKNVSIKKNAELKIQEDYHNLQRLTDQLKTSIERERRMVAAELHEELAQLATAVRVDIDWLSSNVPPEIATLQQRTTHALAMTDLLVSTIRRISFELHPAIIDDLGLDPALEEYCRQFTNASGISCSYKSTYNGHQLDKSASLDVFRICQAILSQIRQQGNATNVNVTLSQSNEKVILTVTEDGTNFSEEDLSSIRQRATSIHAKCTISNDSTNGNSIVVEV